ncbi:hypothetical protein SMACR_01675 [Sordaria macrospora]|uniref:WGS project CABT00000000 data, contig 2.5 n=2 Tax=Sordaria macrospora TaxID=5147 RepID=F7VRJ0_SORMK|nr:uncharacterized protein SMAC_01675 [Sordaria macrospora k-hell]KAA8635919.1 hypothetical protein SMACR_01675 [Sordaria macrospora]WPJ61369.1 hypothetical protein SMAC4_01675 [Sordaria macrospora]CCC08125.1 unnamed protein product [Sordaria macrospora k-hell]
MPGLKYTALFSALVVGSVVNGLEDVAPVTAAVPNPQSLYIQFMHPTPRSYGYGQDLGFRLSVNPSFSSLTPGNCASPNITINNQPLLSPPSEDGSFTLDNDIKVDLTWESRCFPSSTNVDVDVDNADPALNGTSNDGEADSKQQSRSQSVTLDLKSVDGQPVKEELSCTIWFRQEEPVWAFGVAGWCVDARIRDVRGKHGRWEVIFDDATNFGGNAVGEGNGGEYGKGGSRVMRLMTERKEFEKEVECLEYRRSVTADQEEEGTRVVRQGHGHGYAQQPVVSREYAANRQRLETLCANLPPRAVDTSISSSVHPPWQLPHHRPARPARLPFPDLFLDSPSPSIQKQTLALLYASLRASFQAHLAVLSSTRLAAYLIFLSLPIFACLFHCLRRLRNRRRRLARRNGLGEPAIVGESPCPGFYGSDESCGECMARYFAQMEVEAGENDEECGSGWDDGAGEKVSEEVGEEESLEEKGQMSEERCEGTADAKEEKERLSEQEYQHCREYHAVPEDGFALRYEPGSETQTVHEPVAQQVVVVDDDDDDDERGWDEKETLVDSEDEREKARGDEVGESSNGEDSGGEESDDDLSIGGELASFMRAANLVEDMIRAGARREAVPRPRPEVVAPVNIRRQAPGTPPPPSYGEVVGLRGHGIADDEGLPPRYEEHLRSRR